MTASPSTAERLAALRAELARRGLDGFLVPRADEHQGEYVPASAERLAWLTGFTGSAGMAAVLPEEAAVFVDGRYVLQVRQEVDERHFTPFHLLDKPLDAWLQESLKGRRIAYDPRLHTQSQVERLRQVARLAGGEAVAVADNPLDAVWRDRPAAPQAPAEAQPLELAGRSSADKRHDLGARLGERAIGAAVLTLPDSIAWLLNVRGRDVPRTPFVLSFALLRADGSVVWFVDPAKVSPELRADLGDEVTVASPDALPGALDGLRGKTVLVDPASAGAWFFDRLGAAGASIVAGDDPCQLPKACKNAAELAGARAAHRRDGAALVRFLAWLDRQLPEGVTEAEAAARLAAFRAENERFRDLSFDTIAGSGPNGAIVHYRVSPGSDRALRHGELFLLDSGAQYQDGTTDVTRTLAVGAPSEEMRDRFTRVLKGHIALATARFPAGTTGHQLDALARRPLWEAGLDFDHGTGHGVGSYLSVHEGPQRISKAPSTVALRPGMIVSNEPGYYKTGAWGIRIENLVAVTEAPSPTGAERPMLAFETLTLAPIDRSLIATELLSPAERAWLDDYHARVAEAVGPQVDAGTRGWLEAATAPLD